MKPFPLSLAQIAITVASFGFVFAIVKYGLGDMGAACAAATTLAGMLWAFFQKPGGSGPPGTGGGAAVVTALVFAFALAILPGCGSRPKDAHDIARVGVISAAAATRAAHDACAIYIINAVDHADELGPEAMRVALRLGGVCEQTLKQVVPVLEGAAAVIDAWDARKGQGAICAVARVTDALAALVLELRQGGAAIPWELDQAIQAGRFAAATCVVGGGS